MSVSGRLRAAKIPEGEIKVILSNLTKLEQAGISKDTLENVVNNIIKMKEVKATFSNKNSSLEALKRMI
jgi:hypothetical protein